MGNGASGCCLADCFGALGFFPLAAGVGGTYTTFFVFFAQPLAKKRQAVMVIDPQAARKVVLTLSIVVQKSVRCNSCGGGSNSPKRSKT